MSEKRRIFLPNYSPNEGQCACGCGFSWSEDFALRLQAFIMILTRHYGTKIRHIVTGGNRCKAHNATIHGAVSSSEHMRDAADGIFEQWIAGSWEQIPNQDVACMAMKSDLFSGIGWMTYQRMIPPKNLIHLDIRTGLKDMW